MTDEELVAKLASACGPAYEVTIVLTLEFDRKDDEPLVIIKIKRVADGDYIRVGVVRSAAEEEGFATEVANDVHEGLLA